MLAPRSSRRFDSALACCLVRVTTIVLPKSGRFSNQLIVCRMETTLPTIVIAGAPTPASATRFGRSPIVATSVRCRAVVAL